MLWLEVSGVFFGLFMVFALVAVVHLRGEWRPSAAGHRQLEVAVAMLAFFGYFCVSNFVHGAAAGTAALERGLPPSGLHT